MERFFVNVPYSMLLARIDEVVARGLLPEIVLGAASLDRLDRKRARGLAKRLHREGLENTIHAPFRDLSPGGADPKIRAVTRERLDQTMDVAEIFRPRCVVFHPGFDPWRFEGYERLWLRNSVETWAPVVERAGRVDITVAIENVFEKEPTTIRSLVEQIGSPHFRHCLDVGHLHVFADTSMADWMIIMAPHIVEIHLHDNTGTRDQHLPMGMGNIDFSLLFRLIRQYVKEKPIYALEPSREEDLEASIRGFAEFMEHSGS
jgi:sugar phosphate isomerase/epimerase